MVVQTIIKTSKPYSGLYFKKIDCNKDFVATFNNNKNMCLFEEKRSKEKDLGVCAKGDQVRRLLLINDKK